jgi:hypothetical protein
MGKLFNFILVLTLINFSTQFFFDSETDEFNVEIETTPNPVVWECVKKVLNKTEAQDCLNDVFKYWSPITTTEVPKTNRTECCRIWDDMKCYLKYYEKVCTHKEVKELETFQKFSVNEYESNKCKLWPFKEDQKLCHNKTSMN